MASTTNYGWTTPDDTSLVKDGADAIRTLGSSVDDSLWYSGYGQAGKNKIINGDFRINQRAFTSTTTTSTYGFDRFTLITAGDGTTTYSAQTFTPGAAPVSGYEAINFARLVTTGQTNAAVRSSINQPIEDVRTFAGQTVTVSFWAKANSGTPKVAVELRQDFGSGGSTAVNTYGGQVTLSTSWARYSVTVAVPSISGKTIGTSNTLFLLAYVSAGSDFNSRTGTLGIQTNTFDFWGVQVEAGDFATPFQTASGGSIQAELAMCQRYYYVFLEGSSKQIGFGQMNTATAMVCNVQLPNMRVTPTLDASSGTDFYTAEVGGALDNFNSFTIVRASNNNAAIFNSTEVAGTAGQIKQVFTLSASAKIAFNAEI